MEVLELSKYVIKYAYDKGTPISNYQLQKILYLLWIEHYRKYKEYLFTDTFEARVIGPVIDSVYYRFHSYGSMTILPSVSAIFNPKLDCSDEKKCFIKSELDTLLKLSIFELKDKVCQKDHAYDVIYKNGEGKYQEIPFEVIIDLECN